MNDIQNMSVQRGGGIASALLGNTTMNLVDGTAVVQVPMMKDGVLGHIYVSTEEYDEFVNSAMMAEIVDWMDRT